MKKGQLTPEEKGILGSMKREWLQFFVDMKNHKQFDSYGQFINFIIDLEKNRIFGMQEYDERKLSVYHAEARGGVGMLVKLGRIIVSTESELNRRDALEGKLEEKHGSR